ncbi:BMP family ABC transporter substrate-binding protein [Oceanithermus desulfurans]
MRKGFLALLVVLLGALGFAQGDKLKACWIYVGPVGDYGWSHAHDQGRIAAEKALPWLETQYVESVPEAQAEAYIDRLVKQGCEVIFATSFGYMDSVLAAARKHPDVIFAHATGFKRAPNVATYMADFYQLYYLNGLMAGALTKTGKVGYVGAFPIPELKRHISAFALGVRTVNPDAEVLVRWIYEWYNPAAAKEATEALIAEGADVFAFTEDTPTVIQVAAKKGLPSFSHYSPMKRFAPDQVVSGQLVHWEKIYIDFLAKVYAGVYTNKNLQDVDYWWLLPQGAVELGGEYGEPVNPKFAGALKAKKVNHPVFGEISVYDLVMKELALMSDVELAADPFQGPIKDRQGKLRVPAGLRLTKHELETMEWAAPGIKGPWPNEPK